VHNYIKTYKLRQWTKTCNSLADPSHPTKYWKRFNALTGKFSKSAYPLLHGNQALHSDQDKANAFADYLQDIFTPHISINPLRRHPADRIDFTSPHLQPNIDHPLPDHPLTAPITSEEIIHAITHKRNSAPGIDQITYRHLKEAPYNLLNLQATIFTFILCTGYIPLPWKPLKRLCFPNHRNHPILYPHIVQSN